MHVGILEDNAVILDMLTHAMEIYGHTVSSYMTASSLFNALFDDAGNAVRPAPFDILLADYLLPEGMTGEDVVERIRKHYSPQQLPIVVISGTIQRHLVELNRRYPDVIVIPKPVSLEFLFRMMKKAMEQ